MRIRSEDNELRRKGGKLRVLSQQQLAVDAVRCNVRGDRQAPVHAGDLDRGHQMIDGVRSKECEARGREPEGARAVQAAEILGTRLDQSGQLCGLDEVSAVAGQLDRSGKPALDVFVAARRSDGCAKVRMGG